MKTVVITGANRGIGLALSKHYVAQGWKVISVCRHSSEQLDSSGGQVIAGIDVTHSGDVATLTQQLRGVAVDLLINNAGILRRDGLDSLNYDEMTQQFLVNAVAPVRVSEALLGNLHSGSKIAFVTSRMGSIADNSSGGYYGYRMSKAALNAAAMSLSHDVKARGIAVAILHPGFVQTDMVNFAGDISADEAAQRLSQRIAELTLETSGGFWHSNGDRLPW